jgi:hypothetical protein
MNPLLMSESTTIAFMSWLQASGRSARATGKECARIIPRMTIRIVPWGKILVPSRTALFVM